MVKVQDFIRYLEKNFGTKITESAYHTYDGYYFLPTDRSNLLEVIKELKKYNKTIPWVEKKVKNEWGM